jgi:ribosomal protein S18 acetylase RimI-like enzyme
MTSVKNKQIISFFHKHVSSCYNASEIKLGQTGNPFQLTCECYLENIGFIKISPFSIKDIGAFQTFYDGEYPEWGLSKESKEHFEEHPNDVDTLEVVAKRVTDSMDARHLIHIGGHVVGYLIIEEIGCIKAGKPTFWNESYHAMLGIGVSDRFHGTGLADFGMIFMKLVAAVSDVGLGLVVDGENERAIGFYRRHGFIQSGFKEVLVPHTGKTSLDPWMILDKNDLVNDETC